jgi:hypothetical protein
MKTYSEKLKDPRWQRKRLEIMQRDNFKCTQCGDTSTTQNVHHWQYSKEPWDAKNEDLTTVCRSCHEEIEQCKDLTKNLLRQLDFRQLLLNIKRLLIKNKELKVIAFEDCVTVVIEEMIGETKLSRMIDEMKLRRRIDELSDFDRLIESAPDDIDYSIPLPDPDGFFRHPKYDAPLPHGLSKQDLPNMASHCKQEICGSCYHEGVFVQWDEDHDDRVLSFIDTIPANIQKSLIAVQEHKGSLGLIWRNLVPVGYEVDDWVINGADGDNWIIMTSWALVCNK